MQGARDDGFAAGDTYAAEGVDDGQGMSLAFEQREQHCCSCVALRRKPRNRLHHLLHEGGGGGVAKGDFGDLSKELRVAVGCTEHAGQACNPFCNGRVA